MSPARFRWGMLFILFGVLILLSNMRVLNYNFWFDFIGFLPLLLIAIGIEKIFTKSRLQFVSYLSSVLLVAGALYIALEGSRFGITSSFVDSETFHLEAEPSVEVLEAVLRLGDGDLTVRDATDDLLYGSFPEFTYKPQYSHKIVNDRAEVELSSSSGGLWGGFIRVDTDEPDAWYLKFSKAVPLKLECYGDESDIHLNLSTTPLRELQLEADDADIYIKLGDLEPDIRVSVVGFDSNLRLRVPGESGLRVTGIWEDDDYLRRVKLIKKDGFFVSGGYDTLPNRIHVDLGSHFGSLSIDYY